MDGVRRSWIVLMLVLTPVLSDAWREPRELRRPGVHYHTKRHMVISEPESKKRDWSTTKPVRDVRKKPSGHLTPLLEDDIENDEIVSVAIGPPPIRAKFEKNRKMKTIKPTTPTPQPPNSTAVDIVKQILTELGRELMSKDLNENFVFGQYVGNAMKNLTNDLRLRMQHEVLDLIMKYQKLNNSDTKKVEPTDSVIEVRNDSRIGKIEKIEKKIISSNDTEESWPDFTNLAKLVG